MGSYRTNDLKLHFTDDGQGEPLLLIHGFPLSAAMWRPQRAALSQRFRVLAIDLRGFGGSDQPTGQMTMDTYADDIVSVLDALGIGQASIAGLSMGGYVTMAVLRRHPERVKSIMLLDTRMTPDTATGRQGRNEMIASVQAEGPDAIAAAMLPKMLTEATLRDNPELVEHVRSMMAACSVSGIVGALEAMRERQDATATLKAASLPALVIVGSADKVTPKADAEAMQRVLQGSELVVIEDAAHLVTLEQPAVVDAAMLTFLTTHVG